jgi:hypothetical protein
MEAAALQDLVQPGMLAIARIAGGPLRRDADIERARSIMAAGSSGFVANFRSAGMLAAAQRSASAVHSLGR